MSRWSAFEPLPLLPHPALDAIADDINDVMSRVDADGARISTLENSDRGLRTDLDQILHRHDNNFREISQALDRQARFNKGVSTGVTLLGAALAGYIAVDLIEDLSRRKKISRAG